MFDKLIELDETLDFKIVNALWETKRFMYLKRHELCRIANYLNKFTCFNESSSFSLSPPSTTEQTIKITTKTKENNMNQKLKESINLTKTTEIETHEKLSRNKNKQ
mgnify:FL=1